MTLNTYFDQHFGVGPSALRKVLDAALSRGGDWADLYFQHSTGMSLSLDDGEVNRANTGVDLGVGIRVVDGDGTGYAFSEDLSLAAMVAAARTAAGIAAGVGRPGPADLTPQRLKRWYDTEYDWQGESVQDLLPRLLGMHERAYAQDSRVQQVQASVRCGRKQLLIVDSDGRVSEDSQPSAAYSLSVVMEQAGKRNSNSRNLASREPLASFDGARLDGLVDRVLEQTGVLFEARKPPQGELPVVLAAGASGILLHEAIGHGMEADFNRKGVSIFAGRIGEAVAQPFVSIVDDGVQPGQRGSINVDDEGEVTEETTLVEDGVLRSYLHDRMSARHYKVKPTGSGRRESFRHAPLPRMRNTYMRPGSHDPEELIRGVKRGIYAETFTNGVVDIGGGDYTFYLKNGWLIEDGKLTAPIKDANLIGNGPQSLERISMVGSDLVMDEGGWVCGKEGQGVPVSIGMPSVLVSKITVGGASDE